MKKKHSPNSLVVFILISKGCTKKVSLFQLRHRTRIFQDRGSFVELGRFDKHYVKIEEKNTLQEKSVEFFPLDTLKTTFRMENLTQNWTESGSFFSNQGTFF